MRKHRWQGQSVERAVADFRSAFWHRAGARGRHTEAFTRELAPAALVLSGDLTQRARRSQFRAARRFVDDLAVPQHLALPGNHDVPLFNPIARIFTPICSYCLREFGPHLEWVLKTPDMLAIGVNTTIPRWRVRIRCLVPALRLAQAPPRTLRMVVVHQPVRVPRLSEQKNLLVGRELAVHRWATAGVDLMLGGHIHLSFVRPLRERFAELSREVWGVQAGTAVSTSAVFHAVRNIKLRLFIHGCVANPRHRRSIAVVCSLP